MKWLFESIYALLSRICFLCDLRSFCIKFLLPKLWSRNAFDKYHICCRGQCPAFQGISFRDGTGRDFCKIPGSRDFPGRDLPHIFIPGFLEIVWDFSGYFCLMRLVINLNIFHEQESPTNIFSIRKTHTQTVFKESETVLGEELGQCSLWKVVFCKKVLVAPPNLSENQSKSLQTLSYMLYKNPEKSRDFIFKNPGIGIGGQSRDPGISRDPAGAWSPDNWILVKHWLVITLMNHLCPLLSSLWTFIKS